MRRVEENILRVARALSRGAASKSLLLYRTKLKAVDLGTALKKMSDSKLIVNETPGTGKVGHYRLTLPLDELVESLGATHGEVDAAPLWAAMGMPVAVPVPDGVRRIVGGEM